MALLIAKILFWSVFATNVACIEIEAEGKTGWAEKMPTWYRTTGFFGKAYGMAMGGKPLTGYHSFMFFVPILIFHAAFFMGAPWSIQAELGAWSLYFSWCVMWDYHWFVLNPHYAKRFTKQDVWWHAKSPWVFGLFPLDYLMGIMVSLVIAGASAWLAGSLAPFVDHLELLAGFGIYTAALHVAAPAYQRWYARMRLTDDRDKTDIFHT